MNPMTDRQRAGRQQNRAMNAPARVLLLEVPKLLRDILQHATRREDDFELETEVEPRVSPDVVILGLTAAEDVTLVPALFARWPEAQVLTVTHAGGDVVAYELSPRRQPLGELSPAEIFANCAMRCDESVRSPVIDLEDSHAHLPDLSRRLRPGSPSGVRTITGVSTSIGLFVGFTRRGPVGKPMLCTSLSDYTRVYGDDTTAGDMARQVKLFFLNGGTLCYVCGSPRARRRVGDARTRRTAPSPSWLS